MYLLDVVGNGEIELKPVENFIDSALSSFHTDFLPDAACARAP